MPADTTGTIDKGSNAWLEVFLETTGGVPLTGLTAADFSVSAVTSRVVVWRKVGNSVQIPYIIPIDETPSVTSVKATGNLIGSADFGNNETVTIGTKVYTFQTTLTDVNGNIQIAGTLAGSLTNLSDAIKLTGTPGTQYAASMTIHPTVTVASTTATQINFEAKNPGTAGNLIALADTATNADVSGAFLTGGVDDEYTFLEIGHGKYAVALPASGNWPISNDVSGTLVLEAIPDAGTPVGLSRAYDSVDPAGADALFEALLGSGQIRSDARQWRGTALATPNVAGVPAVDTIRWAGDLVGPTYSAFPLTNVLSSGQSQAADNSGFAKITLAAGTVGFDGNFVGASILITSGTGAGAVGTIWNTVASTDVALVQPHTPNGFWATPPHPSFYAILNSALASLVFGDVGVIADAIWDEEQSGHVAAGTFGKYLDGQITLLIPDTVPNLITAELTNIADAILKRDWTAVSGEAERSILNALRMLRNRVELNRVGGTYTVYKEDDSTPAYTGVLTTAAGEAISSMDPT
jgi:hypothetical protein